MSLRSYVPRGGTYTTGPMLQEDHTLHQPVSFHWSHKGMVHQANDLEAWDVSDRVSALVFDTTAGVHKGAAKLIEERLGRKLLYLACRHHTLEVVVGAVWKFLFGSTVGPENKFFAHFKQSWKDIDRELPVQTLRVEEPWLLRAKNKVTKDLVALLSSEDPTTFPEMTTVIVWKIH